MEIESGARFLAFSIFKGTQYFTIYIMERTSCSVSVEPRCEKTGLRGFLPGPTQTGLYSHRRRLEA